MNNRTRPLSPHLQIYRFPLSAVLSIAHRITGAGLALGLILLSYFLAAAAYGETTYMIAESLLVSWFGQVVLWAFLFALCYHLCNGIRHLIWDMGYLLKKEQLHKSNLITILLAVLLTFLVWLGGRIS